MKNAFFISIMFILSCSIFAQEAISDAEITVPQQENELTEEQKKAQALEAAVNALMAKDTEKKFLPDFSDEAGKDVCYFVVDGGNVNTPGRFNIGVQVFNYTSDKRITAEVYGWGGKFKEEWNLIHDITMDRFNPTPKLFHPTARWDYTHYRYFAIKILKPKNKKYQIVSDQQNDNLNFYLWDVGANSTAASALVGSTVNVAPKVYIIDPQELAGSDKNNIFIDSPQKLADMPINLYVYSTTRQILVYYGAVTLGTYMDRQKMKRATHFSLDDFRMNSYNINIDKNGINVVIMDSTER